MDDTLIKVEDLCKIYNPGENEVRALDHVSLEIKKGELVAIIGQSGSGKSTFMNMLGCLDVPTSGKYYLNGTDVSEMSDNELSEVRNREIGFIFQGCQEDSSSVWQSQGRLLHSRRLFSRMNRPEIWTLPQAGKYSEFSKKCTKLEERSY